MYGIDYKELAHVNRISISSTLQAGLRLYIPPQQKQTIDVLLYVEPRTPVSQTMTNEVRNKVGSLTYLTMFSYRANGDGSLDARSIQAKFNLIKQFNLRGIMYWNLGLSFPQNWLLLTDNFNVRKRG